MKRKDEMHNQMELEESCDIKNKYVHAVMKNNNDEKENEKLIKF